MKRPGTRRYNIQMQKRADTLKYIFILLLSMQVVSGYASEKERYLFTWLPGIRIAAERDLAYSPLLYSGLQGTYSIAYSSEKKVSSDYLAVNYAQGNIANIHGNIMKLHMAGIQTFKFYHAEADRHKGLHWGWSNNNEFNTRNIEDIGNFNDRNEYFTSFGPAARYRLPFSLFNRQFHLEALAHVQLLGFKLQSSYVTSLPPGFEEPSYTGIEGFLRSIELFYPGNAWNAGIQPTLRYVLKSGNMLSLSYRYDYLRLKGVHTVEKSRGSWSFGIITAL